MNDRGRIKIALIGAGGATFGSLTCYEAVRAQGLRGGELMLIDINAETLERTRAAAERMNRALGEPLAISADTDTARGIQGADFIVLSVEAGRWKYWRQDLEVPCKHGSMQDMGECGGPGGLFHALRTIPLALSVCRIIEEHAPGALLINVTNPLPRVTLAIQRATKLRCIGDCPEFRLAQPRLALGLMAPMSNLRATAWGLNHFTWYHEITAADSGADLYPRLRRNARLFPFLHGKLARKCLDEFGLYPVSADSHIGEYLPSAGRSSRSVLPEWFPYQQFSEFECGWRVRLTEWYGQGRISLPLEKMPRAVEGAMELVEALATGAHKEFGAVNARNDGRIPNLPDWAVVETPAQTRNGQLEPASMPPVPEPLAGVMQTQCEIQRLTVDAALNTDPEAAIAALAIDPLAPPTEQACRAAFEEMKSLQGDAWGF
jgi:alpha-galactosidase